MIIPFTWVRLPDFSKHFSMVTQHLQTNFICYCGNFTAYLKRHVLLMCHREYDKFLKILIFLRETDFYTEKLFSCSIYYSFKTQKFPTYIQRSICLTIICFTGTIFKKLIFPIFQAIISSSTTSFYHEVLACFFRQFPHCHIFQIDFVL
jgi:hypothetical protein